MIELIIMLGTLSAVSFVGGVIMTKELCCMATEKQKEEERR